jgi:membrane protein
MIQLNATKWHPRFRGHFGLFLKLLKKFNGDHCFLLSAGIAFSVLLCLIPLSFLLLSLIGAYLFSEQEVLIHIRDYLQNIFPSLDPQIMENILRIMQDRQIVGVLGLGGLAWAATWVFSSLRTALNIVFEVGRGRNILRGKAIDLLMIFFAGILLLMSMVFTVVINFFQSYQNRFPLDIGPLFPFILKYLTPFFFTFTVFFLIYKIAPNKIIPSPVALKAAFFVSFLWEIAKHLFGWYVLHLGRFSIVYGSLATLAVFFLWIYYSAIIFLLGAEMAALLERERK